MKRVSILILFPLLIFANSINIDTLIDRIKHSYGDERRVLMNQLKLKLRQLNQQQRDRALQKLITNLNIKRHNQLSNGMKKAKMQYNFSHNSSPKNSNQNRPKLNHSKSTTPKKPHTQPNKNRPKQNHPKPNSPKHNQNHNRAKHKGKGR